MVGAYHQIYHFLIMGSNSQLKILTVNCQGLGDINKRRDVFKILKAKKYNIYFLQDTHFVLKDENFIRTQWGSKAFFCSYKSNSRGVAILFNDNCELEINAEYRDEYGNYLILDVTVENIHFLLVNIYGPNIDTPTFYSGLLDIIQGIYSTQHIILGGDFNLILNKILDSKNYMHTNNPKSRSEVYKMIEILNLKDVFREYHAEAQMFTWRRKNPIKQARLDFFLISESLLPMVVSIKSENSYRSDHSPVVLTCKINEFIKGKGFWKFNTSLLLDKDYIELTKQVIKNVKKQYACLVYNTENLCNVDTNMIQFTINDQTFLDILLAEIRGKSISYSTFKKKKMLEKEIELEKGILELEKNLTEQNSEEWTNKHKEIEEIRKKN